jgi:hypothetical protein
VTTTAPGHRGTSLSLGPLDDLDGPAMHIRRLPAPSMLVAFNLRRGDDKDRDMPKTSVQLDFAAGFSNTPAAIRIALLA